MGNFHTSKTNEIWKVRNSITTYGYDTVNVRFKPSVNSPIIRTMTPGTLFDVYEKQGNWLRLSDGWTCRFSKKGEELSKCKYINKQLVNKTDDNSKQNSEINIVENWFGQPPTKV